ncbi:MAG TPA: UDP-N-acetylmuramate--L-alanine ligase [Chthonomonadaceae bacterium]|nr:UDP-N-acetylmuramate--L-alanine ligase [Chthonomonadaceae bacterium]
MQERAEHLHFLGIGGIGVSALAQVALARGARVSGSDPHADPQTNPAIRRLLEQGATLYTEHRPANLSEEVSLVVASAAIAEDNPELREAHRRGLRVISRAEFLGELMAAHKGPKIAVAGTAGKTTTTAMVSFLLQQAKLDPTVFVGGEVPQLGGNVRIGGETGPFVAEACEAYDSFLYLKPDIAVVANIEADHLDYYGTFDRVMESFLRFVKGVTEGGKLIACVDDPGVRQLLAHAPASLQVVGYGVAQEAASRAENIAPGRGVAFDWITPNGQTTVRLRLPGRHNALNALAAATVGWQLGLPMPQIAETLAAFQGVGRRQEILGEVALEGGDLLVMDDYAHHPTKLRATLEALRDAYPDRRLVAVFQPHLYSRTRDFLAGFADALAQADALVVTDIYPAREAPIPGVRAADIVNLAARRNPQAPAIYLPDKRDIPPMLAALMRPNDLVVFLGAGDIREQGEAFVRLLA